MLEVFVLFIDWRVGMKPQKSSDGRKSLASSTGSILLSRLRCTFFGAAFFMNSSGGASQVLMADPIRRFLFHVESRCRQVLKIGSLVEKAA